MRQLFFLLFTFFSLAAVAQTPTSTQYLGAPKTLIQVRGPLRVDSLGPGKSDTTTYKPIGVNAAGDFRRMSAWVGSAGGVGGTGIDSMIIIRDSIFIYTRDTVYYVGTSEPTDTTAIHDRLNDLDARRDTLSITQPDSLHIVICQPTIGRCDTLEWSGSSGGGTSLPYPYTARKYHNGYGAFPTLNSDSLDEGSTNLFFTNARVRAALSAGAPLTYNNTTGAFGITQATTSTDGYLSSTDWNTFNSKEPAIVAPYTTGRYWNGFKQFVVLNSDSIAQGSTNLFATTTEKNHWNTAYDKYIVSGSHSSGTTTFTRNDGTTFTVTGYPTSSGGTLSNIGTGYDVAVQGTSNVKRVAGKNGVLIDSTTTANTVTWQVDSSKYATKWYAQNNLGYDTTRTGTAAQRMAITGLYNGYQFYQTNERIGLWIYEGSAWVHQPPAGMMISSPIGAIQNLTYTSGNSGAAGFNTGSYLTDTLRPVSMLLRTGTTVNGYGVLYGTTLNILRAPIDTSYKSRYVLTFRAALIGTVPTLADNYRLYFGFYPTDAVLNDSTKYGHYFSAAFHRAGASLQVVSKPASGAEVRTTTATTLTTGAFHDYVIVFTSRTASFYVDGVFQAYHNINVTVNSGVSSCNFFAAIQKVAGTTEAALSISNLYLYQTFVQ